MSWLHRSGAIAALCLWALALAGPAAAQQPIPADLANALGYLSAQQIADGSYVSANPVATDTQATARVAQSFTASPANAAELAAAQTFLSAQTLATSESRARRLLADPASIADISPLLAAQNTDGGFGDTAGFGSDVLDTAAALVALTNAGEPIGIVARDVVIAPSGSQTFTIDTPADATQLDILLDTLAGAVEVRIGAGAPPAPTDPFFPISSAPTIISLTPVSGVPLVPGATHFIEFASTAGATVSFTTDYLAPSGDTAALTNALSYLQDARNADGGWGFQPADDDSQLYYTYWAARALGGAVDASAYVLGQQLPASGFSDGATPNLLDTAIALTTLARSGQDPESVAPAAIAFLEAGQLPGGAFDDDPFRTAWAVDALAASRTPLAPILTTNGGAGAGIDFTTDLGTIVISGVAPLASAGVSVNIPGAVITFDPLTGAFSISLSLAEGANAITISALNLAGVAGPIAALNVSRDSSLTGQDMNLAEGLNAIGFALEPANAIDAMGLLDFFGPNASEVQRLDPATDAFESLARDGSGGFTGTNFALAGLDSVFVIATAPASLRLVGSLPAATTIDLLQGSQLASIPSPPAGLGAFDLLAQIGDDSVVSALQRFDPVAGRFETAVYEAGVAAGIDFPIAAGVAYLVSMKQDQLGFPLPIALAVSIASPAEGATLSTSPVTVSGSVTGVAPLTVTVNGVAATVVGNSFSASVPLTPGANVLTAQASDALGGPVVDTTNVTFQAVDYTLAAGNSVQDSRVISGSAATISQVASLSFSIVGLPPELQYNVVGVFIISATEVRIDYQIDAVGGAAPGIYQFQVQNSLLDGGGTPLGPLTGAIFDFSVEVTP